MRRSSSPARAELPSGGDAEVAGYVVSAKESGGAGNGLTVEVQDASEGGEEGEAFRLVVKRGDQELENFDNLVTGRGRQNVATIVNAHSNLIQLEETSVRGAIQRRPPTGTSVSLAGGGEAATLPARLSPDDYVGDSADRTGFGGLEAVEEITMLSVPDLMAAYQQRLIDLEGVQAVQLAMISHCELMGDRLAILDPPPGLNAQQIKEWRVDKVGYDSKQAALYWPWFKVFDPATGQNVFVPPSGHMAGIWARSDATRGVHKAPANEVVRGAIELETNITRSEHDLLNPNGHQRDPLVPRARHPGVGRAHAVDRTRRGATSTSAACSTTSRNRSWAAPSGSCSSPTTTTCGSGSAARSPRSSSASGATARCSARRPARRSTSSATTRPTRPSSSTPVRSRARSASPR